MSTCTINKEAPLGTCSLVHAGLAVGMAAVGAVAAVVVATSVSVAAVAITAGLFAAPAITIGILAVTAYALLPKNFTENLKFMHALHAAAFAIVSAAVLAAAIAFGILITPALIVTFAVTATLVTLGFGALAVYNIFQTPGDGSYL